MTAPNDRDGPLTEGGAPVTPPPVDAVPHACESADLAEAAAPDSAPASQWKNLRLAEWVRLVLHATGFGSLRGVEISVRGCVAHLGGRVPNHHVKQIAQTAAMTVPGIERVHNDIVVDSGERNGTGSS